MPKPKRNVRRDESRSPDAPAVEFLTVGWMISVITVLACELAFAGLRGYLLAVDGESPRLEMLTAVLIFAALVVGLISLALALAVVKAGRTPPPRGILAFSIIVGALPLAAMVLRFLIAGSTSSPIP